MQAEIVKMCRCSENRIQITILTSDSDSAHEIMQIRIRKEREREREREKAPAREAGPGQPRLGKGYGVLSGEAKFSTIFCPRL